MPKQATPRELLFSGVVPFLGMGFGAGLAPKAPGTFGTLVAIPLVFLVMLNGPLIYSLVTLLMVVLGVGICDQTARFLDAHDHPAIVWDEITGYMVVMLFFDLTTFTILTGFILFRLFDILKPWPIRWIDRKVSGGFGMMLDDLAAGLLAALVLYLILQIEFFSQYSNLY